jgi:hypothetical protein
VDSFDEADDDPEEDALDDFADGTAGWSGIDGYFQALQMTAPRCASGPGIKMRGSQSTANPAPMQQIERAGRECCMRGKPIL